MRAVLLQIMLVLLWFVSSLIVLFWLANSSTLGQRVLTKPKWARLLMVLGGPVTLVVTVIMKIIIFATESLVDVPTAYKNMMKD